MTWPTAYAPILSVFVDKAPTLIQGTSYYKHTNRDAYQAARDRIGITDKDAVDEVLLWNEAGEILEGSRRTISVWRDGSWVTPPLSSGCMDGSIRRWMLSTKKVREARVLKEDLRGGEWVLTSNGIEGCCFGKFVAMDREAYKNALRDNAPLPNHSTIDYYPDRNR
ncbi:hypothetical protein DL93DRAFT_2061563 [Clavulina sp. PMI_390]|nr:hypothetical protein DL93DRAFT_2061563 [Clavulina sp. PMI_390]